MKNETDILNEMIAILKERRNVELELLKVQLHETYESLKPINIIKNTFQEVSESSELKNNILSNVIGIGVGFISRKILVGNSHNPVRRLFGNLLQFAITSVVSHHADGIKSTGEYLIKKLVKRKSENDIELQQYI